MTRRVRYFSGIIGGGSIWCLTFWIITLLVWRKYPDTPAPLTNREDWIVFAVLVFCGAVVGACAARVSRHNDWRILATILLPFLPLPISAALVWLIPWHRPEGFPLSVTHPAGDAWMFVVLGLPVTIPGTYVLIRSLGRSDETQHPGDEAPT